MKILTFAASNSKQSINASLATYAANLIPNTTVQTLNIHDYELPIFSIEREREIGQPKLALAFRKKIGEADALVVSFAEHNGNLTAAYKNLFDWASRIDPKVYQRKPAVFLSTSPGKGGAGNVLANVVQSAPYFGADLKANLSIPSFNENFSVDQNKMTNARLGKDLLEAVLLLARAED